MTREQLDAIRARHADGFAPRMADAALLLAEVERLRDAHAMAVQVSGELCEKCGWAMKFPGEKCRCELLAEVERLTAEVESKAKQNVALVGMNGRLQLKVERLTADPLPAAAWVREVERAAFQRGVAAMREAAACAVRDRWTEAPERVVRALPDPEDK